MGAAKWERPAGAASGRCLPAANAASGLRGARRLPARLIGTGLHNAHLLDAAGVRVQHVELEARNGLDDFAAAPPDRLVLVLGTEGDGLSPGAVAAADVVVRIPMAGGVDSLNVAAASAVALWALR